MATPCSRQLFAICESLAMQGRELLDRIRPRTLMGFWSATAFVVAVVRLLLIQGVTVGTLVVFLMPPALALLFRLSPCKSTRAMATLFLTLVDFGVLLGHVPWVFPDLHPMNVPLSQSDNRALTWYMLIYLSYLFVILPPFIFGRDLLRRRRGTPEFSVFTNVLGIVTWIFVGPLMCWFLAGIFRLWPLIRL